MGREILKPGQAWADLILSDLQGMPPESRIRWHELLEHSATATGAHPSRKWLRGAQEKVEGLSEGEAELRLVPWLMAVDDDRGLQLTAWQRMYLAHRVWVDEENVDVLRGLLWACILLPGAEICRALASVATGAFRKIPGVGPRSIRIGNAAVYALGEMESPEAIAQLALLKSRIKIPSAQKGIQKAFERAGKRKGLSPDDLEEMVVPTYDLEWGGLRRKAIGEFTAELQVTGPKGVTVWRRPDGSIQKSVPTIIARNHSQELQEWKKTAKEISAMLPAQSARLERAYLKQRRWDLVTWRSRILDHPLVGLLARRLIWMLRNADRRESVVPRDGKLFNAAGEPVSWPGDSTQVELWHPLQGNPEETIAWRQRLLEWEVRQPFKQAHREVYLLTDAERTTASYSNRFAAHILRQHQFHALCQARGWKNTLRLRVDADYAPAGIELPAADLRAEYWVEAAGDETTDSGVFQYLVTDQVRFYPLTAAKNVAHAIGGGYHPRGRFMDGPLPLETIPPIIFSEVMRDVDLFVGVASVGNDPNWSDGGPEGRFVDYWQSYSFGELGATARTRRDVLAGLLPRLKIGPQCTLAERFLVVRGELRTYKIHLGSGNILMEPNDQYLCIVPKQSTAGTERVFLPFEGDSMLSVVLSKAFLLANDRQIRDPTILTQIERIGGG